MGYPARKSGTQTRSSGTTGAITELLACAELMAEGYHVYRCESPHAPFDLVAYRDGRCLRVEVKTLSRAGETCAPSFGAPKNEEWDLLVVIGFGRSFRFTPGMSRAAMQEEIRDAFGFGPRRPLSPCGTLASYHRHRSRGEECDDCRDVMKNYLRHHRTKAHAGAPGSRQSADGVSNVDEAGSEGQRGSEGGPEGRA